MPRADEFDESGREEFVALRQRSTDAVIFDWIICAAALVSFADEPLEHALGVSFEHLSKTRAVNGAEGALNVDGGVDMLGHSQAIGRWVVRLNAVVVEKLREISNVFGPFREVEVLRKLDEFSLKSLKVAEVAEVGYCSEQRQMVERHGAGCESPVKLGIPVGVSGVGNPTARSAGAYAALGGQVGPGVESACADGHQ